jgi:hypothetical protein
MSGSNWSAGDCARCRVPFGPAPAPNVENPLNLGLVDELSGREPADSGALVCLRCLGDWFEPSTAHSDRWREVRSRIPPRVRRAR